MSNEKNNDLNNNNANAVLVNTSGFNGYNDEEEISKIRRKYRIKTNTFNKKSLLNNPKELSSHVQFLELYQRNIEEFYKNQKKRHKTNLPLNEIVSKENFEELFDDLLVTYNKIDNLLPNLHLKSVYMDPQAIKNKIQEIKNDYQCLKELRKKAWNVTNMIVKLGPMSATRKRGRNNSKNGNSPNDNGNWKSRNSRKKNKFS